MKFLLSLFILLSLTSCSKDMINELNAFQWCSYNEIDATGDSYTYGPGAVSYPTQLADMLGKKVNNYGVSGETSGQVKVRFFQKQDHSNPQIIWFGKNNGWNTADIMHDYDTIISSLPHQMFFLVTTWGTNTQTDWKGDSSQVWGGMLNWVYTERSRMMVEKYGYHCIDLLPILQGYARTYEDLEAVGHNVCPPSLCVDQLHLNTEGYRILDSVIVSRLVKCKNESSMKEVFIVKMVDGGKIFYYDLASVVSKNKPPVISWGNDIYRAYRHDTYQQAQETINAIAHEDQIYQIKKIFVKP